MFENLTDRLSQTLRHVTGKAKLTEVMAAQAAVIRY